MKTEFSDRSGKPIYVGDIVRYRLNSSSATLQVVVKTKRGIRLVDPNYANTYPNKAPKSSIPMSKLYEQYVSIIEPVKRES